MKLWGEDLPPLYFAKNLTEYASGTKIYIKREDLLHTGALKINNTLGQALLSIRMGKRRIIAETGAGQHGVAIAIAGVEAGGLGINTQKYSASFLKLCNPVRLKLM